MISMCSSVFCGEDSKEYMLGYKTGMSEAQEEIRSGEISIYTYGFRIQPKNMSDKKFNFDSETGFPYKVIAGCIVHDKIKGKTIGHNDTIRKYVSAKKL